MNIEKRGFWSWFLQRITAMLLVMGMAIHFFVFHFSPGRYASRYYDEIIHRFCSPGWIAFHICLLAMVVFHGLNGLWGIFADFSWGERVVQFVKGVLWLTGITLFGVGIYILICFATTTNNGF